MEISNEIKAAEEIKNYKFFELKFLRLAFFCRDSLASCLTLNFWIEPDILGFFVVDIAMNLKLLGFVTWFLGC